ncbi:MAG TPA: hypothetical protein VFJ19_05920 [Nocardioidaceae bacterium]|nr:hypothetical protein [Nocardioidaceae bacterium]
MSDQQPIDPELVASGSWVGDEEHLHVWREFDGDYWWLTVVQQVTHRDELRSSVEFQFDGEQAAWLAHVLGTEPRSRPKLEPIASALPVRPAPTRRALISPRAAIGLTIAFVVLSAGQLSLVFLPEGSLWGRVINSLTWLTALVSMTCGFAWGVITRPHRRTASDDHGSPPGGAGGGPTSDPAPNW